MQDKFDCVVIGAGIVGLAIARELSLAGHTVLVLERHRTFGTEISSHNSEVIHAGIYYPENSLKARFCVSGKHMLYRYCEERAIPHRRCGKLIVATTNADIDALRRLAVQAETNCVSDLAWLDEHEVRRFEPALLAKGALHSPSSGIIDSHALMLSFVADAESHGTLIAYNSPVVAGRIVPSGFVLVVGDSEQYEVSANYVINCSGLSAARVAATIRGLPAVCMPTVHFAKGNYFALTRPSPFSRLVYPLPVAGGLGVHVTLDMAGRARFGPDVEWIDELEYSVSVNRIGSFYAAIRAYWPDIADGELQPAYVGIRPKLSGPGGNNIDFVIQDSKSHGVPGFVNLLGIESPGLTASLAIAEHVLRLCDRHSARNTKVTCK